MERDEWGVEGMEVETSVDVGEEERDVETGMGWLVQTFLTREFA